MILKQVSFNVDGMHCKSCKAKIENFFKDSFEKEAKVSLEDKKVVIEYDFNDQILDFKNAITQLGFKVVGMNKA